MTRYKPPTYAEQGGIRAVLEKNGYDYSLFVLLVDAGNSHRKIADTLAKNAKKDKPPYPTTVGNWVKQLNIEREAEAV